MEAVISIVLHKTEEEDEERKSMVSTGDSSFLAVSEQVEKQKIKELSSLPVDSDVFKEILQNVASIESEKAQDREQSTKNHNVLSFNREGAYSILCAPHPKSLALGTSPQPLDHDDPHAPVKCSSCLNLINGICNFCSFCGKLLQKNYGRL